MNDTPASTFKSRSHRMSRTRNDASRRTLARWMRFSMSSDPCWRALAPQREQRVNDVGRVRVADEAPARVRPADDASAHEHGAALLKGIAVGPARKLASSDGAQE